MNHVAFDEALYWRVLAATAIVQRSDLSLVALYQAYSASTLGFVSKVNKPTLLVCAIISIIQMMLGKTILNRF